MFIEILFKILLFKGGVLIYTEHYIYIYIRERERERERRVNRLKDKELLSNLLLFYFR